MVCDQFAPILSSDGEAFADRVSFVDEMASLVECYTICSDKVAGLISQNKLFGPVDLKPDFIDTLIEENDLTDFVELFKQNNVF